MTFGRPSRCAGEMECREVERTELRLEVPRTCSCGHLEWLSCQDKSSGHRPPLHRVPNITFQLEFVSSPRTSVSQAQSPDCCHGPGGLGIFSTNDVQASLTIVRSSAPFNRTALGLQLLLLWRHIVIYSKVSCRYKGCHVMSTNLSLSLKGCIEISTQVLLLYRHIYKRIVVGRGVYRHFYEQVAVARNTSIHQWLEMYRCTTTGLCGSTVVALEIFCYLYKFIFASLQVYRNPKDNAVDNTVVHQYSDKIFTNVIHECWQK